MAIRAPVKCESLGEKQKIDPSFFGTEKKQDQHEKWLSIMTTTNGCKDIYKQRTVRRERGRIHKEGSESSR